MADGAPSDERALPAIDCDVLFGISAIARWMGVTVGQAKSLVDDELIPTFSPPGRTARCALKSELNETFREYANRPGARAKAPARKPKRRPVAPISAA
jgi:hypothetical protein